VVGSYECGTYVVTTTDFHLDGQVVTIHKALIIEVGSVGGTPPVNKYKIMPTAYMYVSYLCTYLTNNT